jgi:hypothetical protein
MIRRALLVFVVALVATPLTATAREQRPRKDRECVQECRSQLRTCNQAVFVELRMCAQSTCPVESDTVKAACADAPRSEACAQARQALRHCLQPCFEAANGDLRTCRSAAEACAGQCPDIQPTPTPGPKDPTCISGCRMGLNSCLTDARKEAETCGQQCNDLVKAARVACATGRRQACAAAREMATSCLQPCNRALREATAACTKAAHACADACSAS